MKRSILFLSLYFSLFTFHSSLAQSWLWGKSGIGWGYCGSVAADGQGNCYLSGYYEGEDSITFSDSLLVNPPHNRYGLSMFLVKYDNAGAVRWARQSINFGNAEFDYSGIVALDNANNAYIISAYTDTIIVGTLRFIYPSSTSCDDYLITSYNSNGDLRWASSQTTNMPDSCIIGSKYVTTDAYGDIFVAGLFTADTVYFRSQYMLGTRRIPLPFIVKYDSTGNVLWARASTVHSTILNNDAEANCVATDRKGNAYLTGRFSDSIWFGSYNLIAPPFGGEEGDVFVTKYSPSGVVLWAKEAVLSSDFSGCEGVAEVCDKSGNVYVAGDFVDTVTFGSYTLIGTGQDQSLGFYEQNNIFLVKYDSNGIVLWAKQGKVLDSNAWGAGSLSIDNYNHIYLSGFGGIYHNKIAFGSDTLRLFDTAYFDDASIIVKFDSNGNVLCSTIIPGGGYYTNSISSDTSGNYIYFGGTAATVLPFGNDTVNPFKYHSPDYLVYAFPFAAQLGECFETVTENPVITNDVGWAEVYPNPNNGNFILSISNVNEKCNVEIYNVLGEKIYAETLPESQNNNINLTGQPNGVYLYRVLKEDGSLVGSGKLVIDK